MKARIEKKLSKKLTELLPETYSDAWQGCSSEPSELASRQGSCVSGLMYVGGGLDYWGEGQDEYSVWEHFSLNWYWILDFDVYPEGHRYEYYPNIDGFNCSTLNKIKRIKERNLR